MTDCFGFCTEERVRVGPDEATDRGLTQRQVLPFISGERTVNMAWSAWHPATVSGFAEQTSIRVNVAVTHAQIVRGESRSALFPHKCPEGLELVADVSVATLDRAISGVFEGVTINVLSASHAIASARADLRAFRGSLQIPFDAKQTRTGEVSLELDFRPQGWAGKLEPRLIHIEEAGDAGARFNRPVGIGGIRAKWPNDGCSPEARAASAESRPPELGGRSVAEVFEQGKAAIRSKNPLHGTWDGAWVGVTLEPLDLAPACIVFREQDMPDASTHLSFQTRARLSASDGHIRSETSASMGVTLDHRGGLQAAHLSSEGLQIPASEFAERAGVAGVDFHGLTCGTLRFAAFYDWSAARPRTDGQIEVDGFRCGNHEGGAALEHIHWCSGHGCEPFTNSPWQPTVEERAILGP